MSTNFSFYRKCFLHFFDIHFLRELRNKRVDQELTLATKMAVLCSDSIVIPAASFYENKKCRKIINSIRKEAPGYTIYNLCAHNPEQFAKAKLAQYDTNSEQYKIYESILIKGEKKPLKFIRKKNSTTGFIKAAWEKKIRTGELFNEFASLKRILPPSFEDTAQNLHNALDGKAYTPEYINNILFEDKDKHSPCASRTTCIINDAYFASYLQDIQDCAIIIELDELDSPYLESHKYNLHIPFMPILTELNTNALSPRLIKSSFSDVLKLKGDDKFMAVIANTIARYCRSTRDYDQLHSINNGTHTTNYFINNATTSQFGLNCSSTSVTTRPPNNTDENGKFEERIMPSTFINNGTVGMMGENNTSNGDIIGQQNNGIAPEHWEAIRREISLIVETKKTLNYDQIQEINNAVEQKDPNKLSTALRIYNISRDFAVSLGASIVANMIHW